MKFRTLRKDASWPAYGGELISAKQNNGEFDFWFVIELIDWMDVDETAAAEHKWTVSLCSVSPSEAGEENLARAFDSSGIEEELRANPIVQVECLKSYGVYAQLWSESGNNYRKLLRDAREQARIASSLYGFYMDRSENRIGSSGWDMQRGDVFAPLKRMEGK